MLAVAAAAGLARWLSKRRAAPKQDGGAWPGPGPARRDGGPGPRRGAPPAGRIRQAVSPPEELAGPDARVSGWRLTSSPRSRTAATAPWRSSAGPYRPGPGSRS